MLLLGNSKLICGKCIYDCNACGKKIKPLAILTGDQAYCSGCFRCRNCKRKIKHPRYARTSHGVFCMPCHDELMRQREVSRKMKSRKLPALPGSRTDNEDEESKPGKEDPTTPFLPATPRHWYWKRYEQVATDLYGYQAEVIDGHPIVCIRDRTPISLV